jgi:hypothetical protein
MEYLRRLFEQRKIHILKMASIFGLSNSVREHSGSQDTIFEPPTAPRGISVTGKVATPIMASVLENNCFLICLCRSRTTPSALTELHWRQNNKRFHVSRFGRDKYQRRDKQGHYLVAGSRERYGCSILDLDRLLLSRTNLDLNQRV